MRYRRGGWLWEKVPTFEDLALPPSLPGGATPSKAGAFSHMCHRAGTAGTLASGIIRGSPFVVGKPLPIRTFLSRYTREKNENRAGAVRRTDGHCAAIGP